MTIRYECGQCGSILKIKDELAGKPGKCPKCKTRFTVPDPTTDSGEVSLSDDPPAVAPDDDPAEEPPKNASASDSEFDPAAFLMQDDSPPRAKRGSPKKVAVETADDDEFHIRRKASSGSKSKSGSLPLDDDEDDEADKRKASRAKPAAAVTGVAASNAAGDLLSQSAKKGRRTSWSEATPNAKSDSGFDWEAFGQYAKQHAPMVLGGIVALALVFMGANWMMSSSSNLPELGQVTGHVKLAGQPVAGAVVLFHPNRSADAKTDKTDKKEKGGKKKKISSSMAVTDEQGQYELSYIVNVKGAPIGSCRVEIEASSQFNVPKKWIGPNSSEFREVKPGKQVFNLDLSQ